MNKDFKDVRIMDNLNEDGSGTSYGAYSLVFPYYIAGKEFYAMLLECRNTSNTAKGLLRHGKCTINFMPFSKKNFEAHVLMGFPGDTPEEKMKNLTAFHPVKSKSEELNPNEKFPYILDEAIQVMECTWVRELDGAEDKVEEEYNGPYHNFNGITSKFGAHFILKVDHILLKKDYYDALVNGVTKKNFAPLPTNWGYRDSKYFWCSDFEKPIAIGIPDREVDLSSVRYAAERLQTDVKFTDDALKMLVKVPRPFLKLVLQGCVNWANENNCKLITEREMQIINDKRSKEKGRTK